MANVFDNLVAQHNAALNTPRHTFTIPKKLVEETGYMTVTLRELIGLDEVNAHVSAADSGAKLAFELVKKSLVRLEHAKSGPLELTAENVDLAFGSLPPKVRNLVLAAYQEIHNPKNDEITDFLGSRLVSV
jgi:hypothetical protein